MTAVPVSYSPDVEKVAADEGETIDGLNETFDTILTTVADHPGHAVRSVHAKAHGILEGTLTVEAGPDQRGMPGVPAADTVKPFAFDLKPGIPTAEVEALVAVMRRVVTHVHFEETLVVP